MRKIIIALVILALVYGLYAIVSNQVSAPQLGDNCLEDPGMLAFLCPIKHQLSTVNKIGNANFMRIQVWLGFALCVFWIIGIKVIRSMGRILNKKIDSLLDSSSDYVIQISNLPNGNYNQTELLKMIF